MADRISKCWTASNRARLKMMIAGLLLAALSVVPASAFGGDIQQAYQVQTLHDAEAPVFLLTAGALGGASADPSLVAVDGDGTVYRLSLEEQRWSVQPLPVAVEPLPLGMISRPTISVGDVLPDSTGDEIVVHSDLLLEVLVQTAPGVWEKQIAWDASDLIGLTWGARVGDVDPARPGLEIVHIFEGIFDFSTAFVTYTNERGEWVSDDAYHAEVGMDSATGDFDPDNPGNEIVLATEMGPTYQITPQPGQAGPWPRETLWDDFDNSGYRVRIADVLPDRPGNEIVYSTRYNNRILLSYETQRGHEVEILFTGHAVLPEPTMWDMAVGNIDPSTPSLEIVGVDGTGRVYLVQYDGTSWTGETIWHDLEGGLFAVAVRDFLPNAPGDEIVVTGESGRIALISRRHEMPGDFDGDGDVDENDRALLCTALGTSAADPGFFDAADFDGNDVIDELDQQAFAAILPPCPGDVVTSDTLAPPADGVSDGADLAFLLGAWSDQPSCADFVTNTSFQPPPDGLVNGADLAYLLGAWGPCE